MTSTVVRTPNRRRLAAISTALVALTVLGSVALTDDAWPVAPFRMFSFSNDPDGVVRATSLAIDRTDGVSGVVDADHVGLRRAELEEQTPWDRRVPDARLAELVEAYEARHDHGLRRLRVIVRTVRMRDGAPVGEESVEVIGEWIRDGEPYEPSTIDLPEAGPWTGYGS